MLSKFEVKNFKNFNENFVFDLSASDYEFNKECIKNGLVNKALIYGPNGCGKSNLGLAIFDIVSHITDKEKGLEFYTNYLNAENNNEIAEFYYKFKFDNNFVEYYYSKLSLEEITSETLLINGKKVISFDRKKDSEIFLSLEGTETLNKDLKQNKISVIKYIKNNSNLNIENKTNQVFIEFYDFVNKFLFTKNLEIRTYIGYEIGSKSVINDIIERNNIMDFELFLNKAGIKCKLKIIEIEGKKSIVFDFGKKYIDFFRNSSTGTQSLTIFYYWLQRLKDDVNRPSLVFIDEFDAFYHQNLAELIIKELKKNDCQIILTTHDTGIMTNDLLRPDCYFIMDNNKINPLSELTDKELRFGNNLEKMYRSGFFNE